MKIVYDNIIYSLQKAGGISLYWSELSSRLKKNDFDITFYGFENKNLFAKNINQKKESNIVFRILRYLPFLKRIPKNSIFHSSYYRVSNQKDIVNITTVHDFTYEYYRTGLARFVHVWQKGKAINESDGIICVSKNTKKDLLKFYPNIKENKIKVIYLGTDDAFKVLNNTKELQKNFTELVDKDYILYVGDRKGYKNFDITVNSLKKLKTKSLVMVGGGELSIEESNKLINLEFEHYLGLPSEKLNILYNNAFCLVYPSSYEGFGIPVLEAMNAGCAVVSTNCSSIPEVAGDAGLLVDKIEVEEFVKAILKLEAKEFRDELIKKGLLQAKKFSWDKCFEETLEFYKEIVGKKF